MDVLYEKAKVLYHDESEESIWEYRVPELIDRLYESMDQNDPTVSILIDFLLNFGSSTPTTIYIFLKFIKIGLCSSKNGITAKIILAGDPKQLNAVCKSDNAGKLGYKTSLMERLFNRPLYMKHPMTGKLNPRYITQLVQNYRSHGAILHVANRLFYDGELISRAPEGLS